MINTEELYQIGQKRYQAKLYIVHCPECDQKHYMLDGNGFPKKQVVCCENIIIGES